MHKTTTKKLNVCTKETPRRDGCFVAELYAATEISELLNFLSPVHCCTSCQHSIVQSRLTAFTLLVGTKPHQASQTNHKWAGTNHLM